MTQHKLAFKLNEDITLEDGTIYERDDILSFETLLVVMEECKEISADILTLF